MKILFLSDGIAPFSIGGMQKYASEMVKCFLEKGCKVSLVFCVDKSKSIPSTNEIKQVLNISANSDLTTIGLHFPTINNLPGHYIKESYQFSVDVFNIIKSEINDFDFIYAQGFSAWHVLEQKQKLKFKTPIGIHFHGLNMFQKIYGIKNKLNAYLFRKPILKNLRMADVVFSYGGKLNQVYHQLKVDHKLIFQPIGIDKEVILNQPSEIHTPLKFLFIGRNDRVKGLNILNDVIVNIPKNSFEFNFIGDIPKSMQMERSDCYYHGIISDEELNLKVQAMDVLLCPSLSEGMPYVILEGMSKGLIVIASNVGAIAEMIDSSNGILIEPNNRKSLANAINSLNILTSNDLNKMKMASIQKAHQFDWQKIIMDTLDKLTKLTIEK